MEGQPERTFSRAGNAMIPAPRQNSPSLKSDRIFIMRLHYLRATIAAALIGLSGCTVAGQAALTALPGQIVGAEATADQTINQLILQKAVDTHNLGVALGQVNAAQGMVSLTPNVTTTTTATPAPVSTVAPPDTMPTTITMPPPVSAPAPVMTPAPVGTNPPATLP